MYGLNQTHERRHQGCLGALEKWFRTLESSEVVTVQVLTELPVSETRVQTKGPAQQSDKTEVCEGQETILWAQTSESSVECYFWVLRRMNTIILRDCNPRWIPWAGAWRGQYEDEASPLSFEIYIMENVNYVQKERRWSNKPLCTYQLFSTSVNSRSFLQALHNCI